MDSHRWRPGPNSVSGSAVLACVGVGGSAVRVREASRIARLLVCGTPKSAAFKIPAQAEKPQPRRMAAY